MILDQCDVVGVVCKQPWPLKVDNPCSVNSLIRTLIFEWYVVWCGSKNKFHKDTSSIKIGLVAQNMVTHSRMNIICVCVCVCWVGGGRFRNCKESGCNGLSFSLLIILCISYPRRGNLLSRGKVTIQDSSTATHLQEITTAQCPGRFLDIIGWDPSVSKSNRLHVDICRFLFMKMG
jgi:hypothetical protein